ncbi:response regulator transcription factor [Vibrio algarum]|uniref:Response regulator transcription factor n=1 Tax=Vibrio algarum TaxID=3020714 RepID=A0ABT4YN33_9VIBR|nr:response regulator transcription factor [Vibrio sp. KJ40-1]MDB1122860.1 response regulator transcription factor [Vibrio sp. KJ40-1]
MTSKMNVVHIENDTYFSNRLKNAVENHPNSYYSEIPKSDIEDSTSLTGTFLYVFDFKTATEIEAQLKQLTEINKYCFTVVYDAPTSITTSDLIKLGRLKGYLFSNTSSEDISFAINALLCGDSSLPLSISNQLIEYYQSLIIRFSEPYNINLTQREIQVLERLRLGLSNNKLADELFVSEHTVKSHLYKIFKKIKVSNRTQAIAWTHKYLP